MIEYRSSVYNPKPGDKLVFGRKPGKVYSEPVEVPDPWYFAPPQTGLFLCDTCRSDTYRSQGYGADRYAKGAAERSADFYTNAGFEVHVRKVTHEPVRSLASYTRPIYDTYVPVDYQIWVAGENVAGPFTPYVCGESFAETVRKCWERGVNPRVYYPFLPHGFEEKNGFDFFGQKTTSGGVQ